MKTRKMRRRRKSSNPQRCDRHFSLEPLEAREMLAADWQNPANFLNVNNDPEGFVSPVDRPMDHQRTQRATVSDPDTGRLPPLIGQEKPAGFYDVDGDGFVSPIDALKVINRLNFGNQPPTIHADLLRDTAPGGETDNDRKTYDSTINGVVADDTGPNMNLVYEIDGSLPIPLDVSDDGSFVFQPSMSDGTLLDGSHEVILRATDAEGMTTTATVSFLLDATAPSIPAFALAEGSRLSPDNPALTQLSSVAIHGLTDPGQIVTLLQTNSVTVADQTGVFSFSGLETPDGVSAFTTVVEDEVGNESQFTLSISQVMPSPVAPSYEFLESENWLIEHAMLIGLGQVGGSRSLSFDVEATFNETDQSLVGDLFQVYLVDPRDPGTTVLDRGIEGEAIFSLSELAASFMPGLVTFDGTTVTIDLTPLGDAEQGLLVFQFINGDGDTGGAVTIGNLTEETDIAGNEAIRPLPIATVRKFGGEVELANYSVVTESVDISVENVRVDSESGKYYADIQLRNSGPATSRHLAIRFNDLPPGIVVGNPSGRDSESGAQYLNLEPVIPLGGLDSFATSPVLSVEIDNPQLDRFELDIDVLSAGRNRPPQLSPIPTTTVTPGQTVAISLEASDPNDEPVYFTVQNGQSLPANVLRGNELVFMPTPADLGTYSVVVLAKDRLTFTEQTFALEVVADANEATRLSGRVMDSDGETSLPGVPIAVGNAVSETDDLGYFTLEVNDLTSDDVVEIRANEAVLAAGEYPFVAEKIGLVLTQGPFGGVDNVIERPIFLPVIDVDGGAEIRQPDGEPEVQEIEQQISPGEIASVSVVEGSLLEDNGDGEMIPFSGVLSITEVPPEFTPAALPPDLRPSTVVTIQPGEMVFEQPAPLTLPNREGFRAGTVMNLWSINPTTGRFEVVGEGRVSEDGSTVETVDGGIRNSSWHFFAPEPQRQTLDIQDQFCGDEATVVTNSELELHSGAIREQHNLVAYRSLDSTQGLSLHYNSERADARPIVYFGLTGDLDVSDSNVQELVFVGRVSFSRGSFQRYVEGFGGNPNVPEDFDHFWSLPEEVVSDRSSITSAVQGDLSDQPSGVYEVTAESALYVLDGIFEGSFVTTVSSATVPLVHVNSVNSPFGAGWELGGIQTMIENPNGELLLVDGSGEELVFLPPPEDGGVYESPPGDFTTVEKNADGTITRTTKHKTVYHFDAQGRLRSITDRNGNETKHVYIGERLSEIIDPVGLATSFEYGENGRVEVITDPFGRETTLEYEDGQLKRITDPDDSSRTFSYDTLNHLTEEVDQRGNVETTIYGPHGRAQRSIRKDGSVLNYEPLQTSILERIVGVGEDGAFPEVEQRSPEGSALVTDAIGNVTRTVLDRAGQYVSSTDSVGRRPVVSRNNENLIAGVENARQHESSFRYDDRGNLVYALDDLTTVVGAGLGARGGGGQPGGIPDGGNLVTRAYGLNAPMSADVGESPTSIAAEDLDGDGIVDLVVLNDGSFGNDSLSILMGRGDGTFWEDRGIDLKEVEFVRSVAVGDFNSDDIPDLAVASWDGPIVTLLGRGDGSFTSPKYIETNARPRALVVGDFNADRNADIAWSDGGVVSLLVGTGDGEFAVEQSYQLFSASSEMGMAGADFNDDGITDVVVTHVEAGELLEILVSENGEPFRKRQPVGSQFRDYVHDVVIGDFNKE